MLYYAILYYNLLYYTILYYTILYYTILYYIVLELVDQGPDPVVPELNRAIMKAGKDPGPGELNGCGFHASQP